MSQATVATAKLNNHAAILATNTAPTFAVGGVVTTDVGINSYDDGESITQQADGKILLGGFSGHSYFKTNFALVRYNSDGSLDLSFDGDGRLTTNVSSVLDKGFSAVVQVDGKILLGGNGGYDFTLVRYNSDGSLDLSFDVDGIATVNVGNNDNDFGYSVALQTDGKILLGGTSNGDFALVRYNTDGSLDVSFDDDGKVITNLGGYYAQGYSVAVQADGKILLGGHKSGDNYNVKFALARYNTDGSLDTSFSDDGIVTTFLGGRDSGTSVAVQTDGKILLGGISSLGFALVRYNSDGSLDTGFDDDGKVTTNMRGSDYCYSVAVQTDGKILLGGSVNSHDFALLRYNSDGSPDLNFGSNGIVTTNVGGYGRHSSGLGRSVIVQADGKILLGGSSNGDFALIRYNSDGSLDSSFNRVNNTLNGKSTYYTEDDVAVVLDNTVQIYDAELAALGNYNGASITLARQGGANAEDVFSDIGQLSFSGSDAILSGINIGTVSNSNGTLIINFNSDATQARVDAVLSSIAYSNTTDHPPIPSDLPSASVQIDWTFNDGNAGTQGMGEALTTTGSSIINILANLDEVIGTTRNDSLIGWSSANKIYGFAGNDTFVGWGDNDTLDGGLGNDTLNGGKGTDSMLGGLGNDLYIVDRGRDVVVENLDEGTDTINSKASYSLPANVENLTLIGSHSINGKGNDLANTLIGNDQDNRLSGGAGADSFSGALGADTFKFNTTTETGITATTRDIIVDFSHYQGDKINLSAIDANTVSTGNNAFAVPTVGGAFSGTFANPGELYFNQTTHILYGNNDADNAADFSIQLMGVNSLSATSFVL